MIVDCECAVIVASASASASASVFITLAHKVITLFFGFDKVIA